MIEAYAFCPACDELTKVTIADDCKICDEPHLDLLCPCGRRFHALPHQVTYANTTTRQEEKN